MSTQVWDKFMASLQEANPSFSRRPSQEELVEAITETLEKGGHNYLIAKAGTGTGKSLASVIPALGYMRQTNATGPVIISTATKNLQGQYFGKDLPEMAKHFPSVGQKASGFTYTVLKGKSNYLCQANLDSPAEGAVPEHKLHALREFVKRADEQTTGEITALPLMLTQREARGVTISANDCPGASDCPFGSVCFYEKAKARATQSDVLVVNHALLMIDAKIRMATEGMISLLPAPGVLVIDECHKLTGYAQNALSWSMSGESLNRFANEIIEDDYDRQIFKLNAKALFDLIPHVKDKDPQHIVPREKLKGCDPVRELTQLAVSAHQYWMDDIQEARDEEDRKRASAGWKKVSRCRNLLANLDVVAMPVENDNFWTEIDSLGRPSLYYKPKEIADFLRNSLWSSLEDGELRSRASAVLMSATPGQFDIGLPLTTGRFNTPSPFDYRKNARVFIPRDISGQAPYGTDTAEWERVRDATMLKLVEASQGRALLLFTSWKDLNRTYDKLGPVFRKHVTVFRQEKDNEFERDSLARKFKEDETSVLFGTESFFEGVDVPGPSLRLVVISKLPFPGMVDATRGGKLDFSREMMPEMKLKLEQAAGRLIRSTSDQGLVAVIDSRLLTKGYGKPILGTMPPFSQARRYTELADAVAYLESLGDDE